ncbi:MAG: type II secretion system protein [Candidatus Kerfeldbacteria bacterium]|nr:type II secretion system protein [Candidatus Kerfeldbacteria bacterium]
MQTKKGFTLIELLVVIAIIGILSAIGLVTLSGAREKARDAARKSDIGQIRTALVLYFDDHDSEYPGVATINESDSIIDNGDAACNSGIDVCDNIVTEYLDRMPAPPNATGTGACALGDSYWYTANDVAANDASDWALWTRLEANACEELYIINESGFGDEFDDTGDETAATEINCDDEIGGVNACDSPPTNN